METETELPRNAVRRLVKGKLDAMAVGAEANFSVNKEAVHAFAEAGRVFIHFITAGAQEICTDKKRQTIGTQDVLDALEGFNFGEMVAPLQESLEGYRRITKERNERRYETVRKRKAKQAALDAEAAGEGGATPAKQAKAGGEGGEGAAEGEAAPAPADGD